MNNEWKYASLTYPTGMIKVRYRKVGNKLIIHQNRPPFEDWGPNYNASVTNRVKKLILLSSTADLPSSP